MDHSLPMQGHQIPGAKGIAILSLCVMLHVTCVRVSNGTYDVREFFRHFDLSGLISGLSGIGSVVLAVIMGNHYRLRNKLLKKELREKRSKMPDSEKEEEDLDNK